MRPVTAALVIGLAASVSSSKPSLGQDEVHIWNGVMRLSSGATVEVFLTAAQHEDGTRATMSSLDGPVSPVTDLVWDAQWLQFRWGVFQCGLEENGSGGYTGNCDIDGGGTGLLTLDLPAALREVADRRSSGVASGGETLTTDELLASGRLTLYEAIDHLRPRWLIPRGPNKYLRRIFVYVYADGQRIGDVEALRMMRPEDVTDVRYYNASEATVRFGAINEGGAIALTRRRQ